MCIAGEHSTNKERSSAWDSVCTRLALNLNLIGSYTTPCQIPTFYNKRSYPQQESTFWFTNCKDGSCLLSPAAPEVKATSQMMQVNADQGQATGFAWNSPVFLCFPFVMCPRIQAKVLSCIWCDPFHSPGPRPCHLPANSLRSDLPHPCWCWCG